MSFWSSLIAFKRLVDTKLKYIQKNTPVMLSFLVQLEIWELRVLRRKDLHHKCFFMKPVRFCRTFVSRHQTAGRLLLTMELWYEQESFYKSILKWNSAYLWSRARLTINKKHAKIFLLTRSPTCWKFDSCFWFLRKDKQGIKAYLQLNL